MPQHRQAYVLVVDDEPATRELIGHALGGQAKVELAGSGQEAFRSIQRRVPDLVVADLGLGDCDGMDVIDRLHKIAPDVPAVVVTGLADPRRLNRVWQARPADLLTKPFDVEQLQATVQRELDRRARQEQFRRRTRRLRQLARASNLRRKELDRQLRRDCQELTAAYRALSLKLAAREAAMDYQQQLLSTRTDDDVFRTLFRTFVQRSGPVHGLAMVCDGNAELQLSGRFGVPAPDPAAFCLDLARPLIARMLASPECTIVEADREADLFPQAVRKYLIGLSLLAMPLIPAPGEMIGLVVFYRKGEQPFTDEDLTLARLLGTGTALAVRRND